MRCRKDALALGYRTVGDLFAQSERQGWMQKSLRLINDDNPRIAGVELDKNPGESLDPIANGIDATGGAHVLYRVVIEASLVRRGRRTKPDLQPIANLRVNRQVHTE